MAEEGGCNVRVEGRVHARSVTSASAMKRLKWRRRARAAQIAQVRKKRVRCAARDGVKEVWNVRMRIFGDSKL